MNSSMNMGCVAGVSNPELAPKAATPYCVEEEETDSGSSSVGDEEVSWSCASEEEVEVKEAQEYPFSALLGHSAPQPQQLLSLERALNPQAEKPARTKLSSNALVFVPGGSTHTASNTKNVDAGRELLTLLKGNSTNPPSKLPSDGQAKPGRSKLSSNAKVFVPKSCFVPQNVVQPAAVSPIDPVAGGENGFPNGAPPMIQLLPTLMIPMCTTSTNIDDTYAQDGFDDSPRPAFPEQTVMGDDSEDDRTVVGDDADVPGSTIKPQATVSQAPSKVCWADLYENEDDSLDIWSDISAQKEKELLSLS